MSLKKAILIGLVWQLAVSAFAASRLTIDQLDRLVASSTGKRDTKIAERLSGQELTERLSASRLAALEAALPGPESRRALVVLADQATFLNPPLAEIPNLPVPTFEQQRDILAAQVTRAAAVAALALFVAVAVSTSVVPVAAYIAAPGPVGSALTRAKVWLARYHRPILMVAFAAIGLLYTVKGAVGLLR